MRPITDADVDAVLCIERAVQAYPWTRGNFTDALASGYMSCLDEANGEIRGYAIWMPVLEEIELLNIAVAAGQQRRGLGRTLLREMLEDARKEKRQRVFLEVRSSNVAAIAFYRSTGFAEIGVRRGYYQNAEGKVDALVMASSLSGEKNGQT